MTITDTREAKAREYCKDIFKDVPCPALHSLTLDIETAIMVYTQNFLAGYDLSANERDEELQALRIQSSTRGAASLASSEYIQVLESKLAEAIKVFEEIVLDVNRGKLPHEIWIKELCEKTLTKLGASK